MSASYVNVYDGNGTSQDGRSLTDNFYVLPVALMVRSVARMDPKLELVFIYIHLEVPHNLPWLTCVHVITPKGQVGLCSVFFCASKRAVVVYPTRNAALAGTGGYENLSTGNTVASHENVSFRK